MELGFLAGRAASLSTLHPELQRAVIGAPTGFARIEALSNHVHRENSAVTIDIRREGIDRRVVCQVLGFQNSPCLGFAEWKVIAGIIDVVRSAAGPGWCPAEITFVSRGRPSDAALEAYGNTCIRLAQSGSTYSDIVQEARFSIASDLMADSDLNIADIAFAAGYENAPHFSRAFKRLTGMTPRDYRCSLAWNRMSWP